MTTTPLAELDLPAFDIEFVERCGTRHWEPLERLFSTARRAGPVSYAGFRWSATTGRHVGFESWLERDHAMLLDFDPDVIGLCSQPFWLRWHDGRRVRRHALDCFVRWC